MNKHAEVQEKDPHIDLFVLRKECDASFVQNCGGIIVNTHLGTFGHLLKILLYICSCRIHSAFESHLCFPRLHSSTSQRKKKSNLITKVSIFYHAQTTNNSYFNSYLFKIFRFSVRFLYQSTIKYNDNYDGICSYPSTYSTTHY